MNIDFKKMALDSKSHTAEQLEKAVKKGRKIWEFNSGISGLDDLLIYDNEDKETIMQELEEFHEVGAFALDGPEESPFDKERPNYWSVERLSMAEIEERWSL